MISHRRCLRLRNRTLATLAVVFITLFFMLPHSLLKPRRLLRRARQRLAVERLPVTGG